MMAMTANNSRWLDFWNEFRQRKGGLVGLILLIVLILAAALAPLVSPQNPYDMAQLDLESSFKPPQLLHSLSYGRFMLGSDSQGRCVFSAVLYGMRTSLIVALTSTIISVAFGVLLGLIAGYKGGLTDSLIMRIADIQFSFPAILIGLVIMALWGQGLVKIIVAISICNWVFFARPARGSTLMEKEKDYVSAARLIGMSPTRIMLGEVLPNILAPVIVIATVRIANTILLESTLSFLGVGVPLTEPSLGSLINSGYKILFSGNWWVSVFPGVALMLIVFSINLLGDRLRDILNPRLKQ